MKKIILLLLCCCFISAKAQVFKYKIVTDRFEDIVSHKEKKTIITMQDSIISFEEKGKKPIKYIITKGSFESKGSKDSIVNIGKTGKDIYGYIENRSAIKYSEQESYKKGILDIVVQLRNKHIQEQERQDLTLQLMEKFCYIISHYVVVDNVTHELKNEMWEIKPMNENLHKTLYGN